ncbi:MAG: PsbP-related protein [Nitrososphaeraceae archaeon]|nr:PsbP-related protein [Nitrososphaeraceae archaeon]MDW0182426.1 PsbP-related protein [Nitrososphaeraceae archaeon]MDW0200431.1 PsbP-related protein [Nitrososphaeraceae archaeon]MDW0215813.1 PsbP-related protein [Nitrososphaeraceae archaeon]MDW0235323.1 PsbP-related protein [Nitrososphaeraceae archaeon]
MSLCYDLQKWTMVTLSSIAITMIVGLVSLVYGQVEEFETYTNDEFDCSVQYPSDWKIKDKNPSAVSFMIPDRDDNSWFAVSVDEPKRDLDTSTMKLRNQSLQEYVKQQLDLAEGAAKGLALFTKEHADYSLIRQNQFTLDGNDWIKSEYNFVNQYNFESTTFANGKFYTLSYVEDPLKVPETLPIVNQMVDSFKMGIGAK